jgi:predicted cupin superfamily sugar epimerase
MRGRGPHDPIEVGSRDASYWIARLGLTRHPEGGYYRETYRAAGRIAAHAGLGERSFSTAIYYLLPAEEVSRLHRLRSDELVHFHLGSPLTLHLLDEAGAYRRVSLGRELEEGQVLQAAVPAGTWFGATVERPGSFALVGCTVAPGFEFADFEQAERPELAARFPAHRAIVERLTRP